MSTLSPQERWERLLDQLVEQGFSVAPKLHARPYSESVYGRMDHGVSRSITFFLGQGRGVIDIHDRVSRQGTWFGYEITRENGEGIVQAGTCTTAKRSEVIGVVRGMLAQVER